MERQTMRAGHGTAGLAQDKTKCECEKRASTKSGPSSRTENKRVTAANCTLRSRPQTESLPARRVKDISE